MFWLVRVHAFLLLQKSSHLSSAVVFSRISSAFKKNFNDCLDFQGERASEFRLLDKKVRARYVREGMAMCVQLPCIECGRLFTHHYGLLYHVERCNVSVDVSFLKVFIFKVFCSSCRYSYYFGSCVIKTVLICMI